MIEGRVSASEQQVPVTGVDGVVAWYQDSMLTISDVRCSRELLLSLENDRQL